MSMHHRHFEAETGLLDARVFAAPDVFRAEQDRLFRRAWLLVRLIGLRSRAIIL